MMLRVRRYGFVCAVVGCICLTISCSPQRLQNRQEPAESATAKFESLRKLCMAVDADGQPLAGARVSQRDTRGTTRIDAEGRFPCMGSVAGRMGARVPLYSAERSSKARLRLRSRWVLSEDDDSDVRTFATPGVGKLFGLSGVHRPWFVIGVRHDNKAHLVQHGPMSRVTYIGGFPAVSDIMVLGASGGVASHFCSFRKIEESSDFVLGDQHRVRWKTIKVRDASGRLVPNAWFRAYCIGEGDDVVEIVEEKAERDIGTRVWQAGQDGEYLYAHLPGLSGRVFSLQGAGVFHAGMNGEVVLSPTTTGRLTCEDPKSLRRLLGGVELTVAVASGRKPMRHLKDGTFCSPDNFDDELPGTVYLTIGAEEIEVGVLAAPQSSVSLSAARAQELAPKAEKQRWIENTSFH